jgi:hypothetical protein
LKRNEVSVQNSNSLKERAKKRRPKKRKKKGKLVCLLLWQFLRTGGPMDGWMDGERRVRGSIEYVNTKTSTYLLLNYLSTYLSTYLPTFLSICLPVCLFRYLPSS